MLCTKLSLFVLNCLPLCSFVTVMLTRPLVVSTSLQTNIHAFSIALRNSDDPLKMPSSSLLIQISSLRRNNNLLTSVIKFVLSLGSRCSSNQVVSYLRPSSIAKLTTAKRPFHQTRKPFYITPSRQKNLASRENYASALHQATILRLSKVGRTSLMGMISYGRVHSIAFQNIIFLCMRN